MIYLKKIPISGDIIKLIIKLRREPTRYSKGFIEEIDGTDHPLMQAVGVYGFAHAIRADENSVTFALTTEGRELWRQILAIARSDPRGKG
jgi:hypothetical protein